MLLATYDSSYMAYYTRLIINQHCKPTMSMAWLQILLHTCLSIVVLLHSLIPIFAYTAYNYLIRGFHHLLLIDNPPVNIRFTVISSSILATCFNYFILLALAIPVLHSSPYCSISSTFVFLLQRPSISFPQWPGLNKNNHFDKFNEGWWRRKI